METTKIVAISIYGLLVNFIGYALYTATLSTIKDPSEEHDD